MWGDSDQPYSDLAHLPPNHLKLHIKNYSTPATKLPHPPKYHHQFCWCLLKRLKEETCELGDHLKDIVVGSGSKRPCCSSSSGNAGKWKCHF